MQNLSSHFKIKCIIFLLGFQPFLESFAQTDQLRLKETYDIVGNEFSMLDYSNGYSTFYNFTDDKINSWWSLLDMYRTTKDKAYLIRFIKISIWVIQNRKDQAIERLTSKNCGLKKKCHKKLSV
jgi:hypothetical protein